DKTIHQLFEEQVERTPDHISVVGSGHPASSIQSTPSTKSSQLTHSELNKKSNQLAQLLIQKGVKKNQIIAIMTTRSIELLIGIMAILKTGCAYLPIEPDYPTERIEFMLHDSNVKLLLGTDSRLNPALQLTQLNLADAIDTAASIFPDASSPGPPSENQTLQPTSLAYTIYTSGSTGKPKGVLVEHYSVVNLVYSQMNQFGIENRDRVLQFSSICFDASVEQLFLTLLSGAALVLISKETLMD
ncbi:MAG: AMP-binding protein, partial [bacterium]|nr:AMP-binding protein [bacterium]